MTQSHWASDFKSSKTSLLSNDKENSTRQSLLFWKIEENNKPEGKV